MKQISICLATLFFLMQCAHLSEHKNAIPIRVQNPQGGSISLDTAKYFEGTVITFYSPDCPYCQHYAKTLNEMTAHYADKNIFFLDVFPGALYPKDTIQQFCRDYAITQDVGLDANYALTKYLHAKVTPQTFVLNKEGKIIYSGKIDNWATAIGQQRQVITEFYLRDALDSLLRKAPPATDSTAAVGCFIEIASNP